MKKPSEDEKQAAIGDKVLKRMLQTPHKPHKAPSKKRKPASVKKRSTD